MMAAISAILQCLAAGTCPASSSLTLDAYDIGYRPFHQL